jgi:signal transduction histidine kinase
MNNLDATTTSTSGLVIDDSFLRRLPNYNPGLVAIIRSPDLRIFFVNDSFEHHLGYSNADINRKETSFREFIEAHQYDHLLNQLYSVKDNEIAKAAFVIYHLKSKNNTSAAYYLYAAPISDITEYGDLYYLLMHPDLTKWGMPFTSFDSKDMFLEQFKSEFFGTFEWIIEADKVYCSPGIYDIYELDISRSEITNVFAREFIHANDKDRVREETKLALKTGKDLNIEYRRVTAKQKIKTIHCLAKAIKNSDGNAIKFAGSIRDVTEQRQIEEDLKNKVAALYQSNKELEEFAYIASHDMQEPLRKITTFSDRLSEKYKDVLTGDGAMYLSRMVASAANMRSLIDDLLEFSRISKTGQIFEKVNLDKILSQVKTDLELSIEDTGTVINSQPLPVVEAIASQMKQLFTNLIVNAIKFRKPGIHPEITIESEVLPENEKSLHALSPNTKYYKIKVTDNGIGFEEEYATRIFQVFQRLHGKSEYPGSGVGLAICKKILEHHKGLIYGQNLPGIGACFIFILPQAQ